MTILKALRSSIKSYPIKNLHFIVIVMVSLAVIAVPLIIRLWSKRKDIKLVKFWASPGPATKYHQLQFDHQRGEFLIEADVFFTAKNNCPIYFTSRDGKEIKADIHFRYTILERDFKDSQTVLSIESRSRRILTEELEKLLIPMNLDKIDSHSYRELRSIRPIFKKRMIAFVKEVKHVSLIGEMTVVKKKSPSSTRTKIMH